MGSVGGHRLMGEYEDGRELNGERAVADVLADITESQLAAADKLRSGELPPLLQPNVRTQAL